MRLLITGANGSIGRGIIKFLSNSDFCLRVVVRQQDFDFTTDCETIEIG